MMGGEIVQQLLDLRRPDIDLERFAAALVVQHMRVLIVSGGSSFGRPDLDDALHPEHLEAFVERAVIYAQQTHHFEREWLWLQVRLLDVRAAWEQGRAALQHDLARASANQEEMDSLSLIDFASGSYAVAAAQSAYRYDQALRKWLINGYMVAWRAHFLEDDGGSE
jgi:hypothetical protein